MGFSRQEYWNGLPCPSPGDLPNPGIEPTSPVSPALQADSLPIEPPGKPNVVFKAQQTKNKKSFLIIMLYMIFKKSVSLWEKSEALQFLIFIIWFSNGHSLTEGPGVLCFMRSQRVGHD